jgi:hypothetical protein
MVLRLIYVSLELSSSEDNAHHLLPSTPAPSPLAPLPLGIHRKHMRLRQCHAGNHPLILLPRR